MDNQFWWQNESDPDPTNPAAQWRLLVTWTATCGNNKYKYVTFFRLVKLHFGSVEEAELHLTPA